MTFCSGMNLAEPASARLAQGPVLGEALPVLAILPLPCACCRLQQAPLWCRHRSAAYASCTLHYALQNHGLPEPVAP